MLGSGMGVFTSHHPNLRRVVAAIFVLVLVPMAQPSFASAAGTNIVSDTFTRSVTGGWGSADTAGSYTLDGGSAVFSVDGAAGSIALPKAGANRGAILGGPSARDLDRL